MWHTTYLRLQALLFQFFENALVRRMVKNTGYLFSATGISAALSFVQGILVARLLGPAGLGILGAVITFTSVVNRLASFRMAELVIKYVGQYTEDKDHLRSAAVFKLAAGVEMVASFVAFGLVWLLAPLAAQYFAKNSDLAGWFILYGLIILANLISESSTGLLQIFDRYRRIAGLNVLQSVVTLAVVIIAYFGGGGMREVLLAYLGGKALSAIGLTISAIIEATRHWGRGWWRSSWQALRGEVRELAHFAVSTNLSASLSLINKDSDLLWINYFRPAAEAGYYKQALALINLVQLPVSPLPQATYPEVARQAARKNWGSFRYILRQGSILAGGFTLVAGLVLILFGRPLISLIYTQEFLPSYPAVVIMLAGFLVANAFYWHRPALLALGRPDFPTKVNFFLAIFKIGGILLLVPRYGYLASAALLAGSYIFGVGVSAWKVRAEIRKKEGVAA